LKSARDAARDRAAVISDGLQELGYKTQFSRAPSGGFEVVWVDRFDGIPLGEFWVKDDGMIEISYLGEEEISRAIEKLGLGKWIWRESGVGER
jgi:hypothetical protein